MCVRGEYPLSSSLTVAVLRLPSKSGVVEGMASFFTLGVSQKCLDTLRHTRGLTESAGGEWRKFGCVGVERYRILRALLLSERT